MKTLLTHTSLLFTGVFIGWQLHSFMGVSDDSSISQISLTDSPRISHENVPTAINGHSQKHIVRHQGTDHAARNPTGEYQNVLQIPTHQSTPTLNEKFTALLNQKAYRDAMDLYHETSLEQPGQLRTLKTLIIERLKTLLAQRQSLDFTNLTDAFLSDYYDDVDILLLLATFNASTGYTSEATRVYQLAFSYTHSPQEKERISHQFHEFVTTTDSTLSADTAWWELQNFYLSLENTALLKPSYEFRLAEILIYSGDIYLAQERLNRLIELPDWREKATHLLHSIDDPKTPRSGQVFGDTSYSLPLDRHGDHYRLGITLDHHAGVNLILDTGASLTTLSDKRFNEIENLVKAEEVGSLMFNTANGMTRGTVYRFKTLHIGAFTLNDIDVAVLNFQPSPGVDGLLGMNVLRQFRFQLNQDEARLYLEKR